MARKKKTEKGDPNRILSAPQGMPANLKGQPHVRFMLITVALAKAWLKHNLNNRTIKEDTVNGYARDMKAGHWIPTHQGIAFNDKNQLIDGQHRLEAIVRANVSVQMMVTFNLPSGKNAGNVSVMDTVDRGAARSVGDVLKLQHDIDKGNTVAAVATVIGNLCYPGRLRKATVPQVMTILEIFGEDVHYAILERTDEPALKGSAVMGAVAFARPVNAKDVEEFYAALRTGAASGAVELLREFLKTDMVFRMARNTGSRVAMAEVVLDALYHFITDTPCHKLQVTCKGPNYFREKQVERVKKIKELFDLPQYWRGPAAEDIEIPAPSNKEQEYQKLREGMNITSKHDDEPAYAAD